jgi:hypothetical protein
VGTEPAVLEPGGDVRCLGPQAGAQHFPVICILEKGFLAADALDVIARLQRTVILARGKTLQLWPE